MKVQVKVYIPPKDLLDAGYVENVLKRAMKEVIQEAETNFKATTATWEDKPDFRTINPTREGNTYVAATGTDDKVFEYVTRGTRRHTIRAKRAKVLRFRAGYRAKTRKRHLSSSSGGAFGPEVATLQVEHPGIEAREFEEAVAERAAPSLERRISGAMTEICVRANSRKSELR